MNILENLEQVSKLLEAVYYELEPCENVNIYDKRKVSFAEDYINEVINSLRGK